MNRYFFAIAFALGLATVLWVGWGFVGTSALALAMTAVIAAVYGVGAWELRQYRAATTALAGALMQPPQGEGALAGWLERLPAALRAPVRLRIEGERVALPGPALTPYLVGLLVMLGMLGTFLGMVLTFGGVLHTLQASADLQALRDALATPLRGLGLAFGTSVAGVAASAMLGLMSALARRERVGVARRLDACIAGELRPLSLVHQRQETMRALQQQAHALPVVAERLQALMESLERRSEALQSQLLAQQSDFHEQARGAYAALAESVGSSLRQSLADGARLAGEGVRPVVESAMERLARESAALHERSAATAGAQLAAVAERFGDTARTVSDGWSVAQAQHGQQQARQAETLDQALAGFAAAFESRAAALLAQQQDALAQGRAADALAQSQRLAEWTQALAAQSQGARAEWQRMAEQAAARQTALAAQEEQRLEAWTQALAAQSQALQAQWQQAAEQLMARRSAQDAGEQERLATWTQALSGQAAALQAQWERTGSQMLAQQQAVLSAMQQAAGEVAARTGAHAGQTLEALATLVRQAEAVVQSRVEAESHWAERQSQRLEQLTGVLRTELSSLREAEAERGAAAVERLGALEAAVASQLATLGASLEAPMNRLLATAAEVPQAAARVITQLREEMGRATERDDRAFAERAALAARMDALVRELAQAAGEQRGAIESLVAAAQEMLSRAAGRSGEVLDAQAGRAEHMAAQVSASAVELSALAAAFQHGAQLFGETQVTLVASLQRLEEALQQSMARSDEQLAYYVAQAREVIDLSITSQQGIVEDLRRLRVAAPALAEGAA